MNQAIATLKRLLLHRMDISVVCTFYGCDIDCSYSSPCNTACSSQTISNKNNIFLKLISHFRMSELLLKDPVELKKMVCWQSAFFVVFGALAVAADTESGAAAATPPVAVEESGTVLADTDKESGAAVVETDKESAALAVADKVKVDILSSKPNNPKVIKHYEYSAHVTLSIEKDDGTLIPSGWSTRKVFAFWHSKSVLVFS